MTIDELLDELAAEEVETIFRRLCEAWEKAFGDSAPEEVRKTLASTAYGLWAEAAKA